MKAKSNNQTTDVIGFLHDRYVGEDPEAQAMLEEEKANLEAARAVYGLRIQAGLSQRQLAKLVGATVSVISRLEDADYDGHTSAMLRRIAEALNQQVDVRFMPQQGEAAH